MLPELTLPGKQVSGLESCDFISADNEFARSDVRKGELTFALWDRSKTNTSIVQCY